MRLKKWRTGDGADFGREWSSGDVVGCAWSLAAGATGNITISFSLNGSWDAPMGAAFEGVHPEGELRPALTLSRGAEVEVNTGSQPFRFAPPPGQRAGGASVCAELPRFKLCGWELIQ